MLKYSFLESKQPHRCQRCGGQLIRSYDDIDCLQCGAPHTAQGKLAIYPAQELDLNLDLELYMWKSNAVRYKQKQEA